MVKLELDMDCDPSMDWIGLDWCGMTVTPFFS